MRLEFFILGSFGFSPLLTEHEGHSMLRLHVGQGGEAGLHLQEDNRVSLSQGVHTLAFGESGQVERVQPLSRHTCVNGHVCLCSRSNLQAAGGYSLSDVINSRCSLLAARREPVNSLLHAPRFIFHDLATASIRGAHPSPSPPSVITGAYDINDDANRAFCIRLFVWKEETEFKHSKLVNDPKMSKL